MVLSSYNSTDEGYAGIVVEVYISLVGIQHHFLGIVCHVEAVLPECVTVLHGLDGLLLAWQHAEGKLTLEVGNYLTRSILHLFAVN